MLMRSPVLEPSLKNLSYILRHREFWPEDFVWNFQYRISCAMGLAARMWPKWRGIDDLDGEVMMRIFVRSDTKPPVSFMFFFDRTRIHEEVSPEMVADQIDEYLARGEI